MMFLNYVIWGSWYVTIGTYLTATLKFSGTETGAIFGTTALASMISPFFVGLIADRFFSSERVLAVLHLVGAFLLYFVTTQTSFASVYAVMLAYCLCYFPTVSLTNSITLRQIKDPGKDFPLIRVFATIGWVVIGLIIGQLGAEATTKPFMIAAGASLLMSVFSLFLPHTPPENKGDPITVRGILGVDAWEMLNASSGATYRSIATLHADDPGIVLDRLAIYCAAHPTRPPLEQINRFIAQTVDVIWFCELFEHAGRRTRRVTAIREVGAVTDTGAVASSDIWTYDPHLDRLVQHRSWSPGLLERVRRRGLPVEPFLLDNPQRGSLP